jgi:ABC-type Fe3+ transport system permease subunit
MAQNWTPPPPPVTGAAIPNNMTLAVIAAVISFLFCCIPHGLISVYFASQVNGRAATGSLQDAEGAAKSAKTWAYVSIGISVLGLIISLAFGVLSAIMSAVSQQR